MTEVALDFHVEMRALHMRLDQIDRKIEICLQIIEPYRKYYTPEIRAAREQLDVRISRLEEREGAGVFELRRRFNRLERESDLEKRVAEVEKRLGIR